MCAGLGTNPKRNRDRYLPSSKDTLDYEDLITNLFSIPSDPGMLLNLDPYWETVQLKILI